MGLINALLGGSEWRDKPREEQQADIGRHKATKKALDNSRLHVREEGPAYYQLNEAVIEAEQHVPWWRR